MLCMVEASRVKRESLWAFLACLYVAALERRRRGGVYAEGRQWWEEESLNRARWGAERQRGQSVWRLACEALKRSSFGMCRTISRRACVAKGNS